MSNELETQDFVIEEDVKEIDPLDELVNMDFTEDNFELDKYHQEIQALKKGMNDDELKFLEAENIIKDLCPKYLSTEYQNKLDKLSKSLLNYIEKFKADGEDIKKIEASENPTLGKDKVYELANFLFNNFIQNINNLQFSMELTTGEHKFLDTVLRQKMEYDSNEVLNIFTLINKLNNWKETSKKLNKTSTGFLIDISIQDVVMIYHFISKYKVKGIGNELMNFHNLLLKIGETNKIFNAYNIIKDRLGNSFKDWASSITLDDEIIPEKPIVNTGNVVENVYDTNNEK